MAKHTLHKAAQDSVAAKAQAETEAQMSKNLAFQHNFLLAELLIQTFDSVLFKSAPNMKDDSKVASFFIKDEDVHERIDNHHDILKGMAKRIAWHILENNNTLSFYTFNSDVAKEIADRVGVATTQEKFKPKAEHRQWVAEDKQIIKITINFADDKQFDGLLSWLNDKSHEIMIAETAEAMRDAFIKAQSVNSKARATLNHISGDVPLNLNTDGIMAAVDAAATVAKARIGAYYLPDEPMSVISDSEAKSGKAVHIDPSFRL